MFKYTSIALVSVGIFICTSMSAKQVVSRDHKPRPLAVGRGGPGTRSLIMMGEEGRGMGHTLPRVRAPAYGSGLCA